MSKPVILADNPVVMININDTDHEYGTIAFDPNDPTNKTLIITPNGSNGTAGSVGTFIFTVAAGTVIGYDVDVNFTLYVIPGGFYLTDGFGVGDYVLLTQDFWLIDNTEFQAYSSTSNNPFAAQQIYYELWAQGWSSSEEAFIDVQIGQRTPIDQPIRHLQPVFAEPEFLLVRFYNNDSMLLATATLDEEGQIINMTRPTSLEDVPVAASDPIDLGGDFADLSGASVDIWEVYGSKVLVGNTVFEIFNAEEFSTDNVLKALADGGDMVYFTDGQGRWFSLQDPAADRVQINTSLIFREEDSLPAYEVNVIANTGEDETFELDDVIFVINVYDADGNPLNMYDADGNLLDPAEVIFVDEYPAQGSIYIFPDQSSTFTWIYLSLTPPGQAEGSRIGVKLYEVSY